MDQNSIIGIASLKPDQEIKLNELHNNVIKTAPTLVKEEYIAKYTAKSHLIRLLMAREWNTNQAFDQWKRWVEWRKQYNADDIQIQDIQSEIDKNKAFWHGQDKEGNPCLIIKARNHFPGQSNQDTLIRFFLYLMDEGIRLADKANTGKIVVIWDREGVTSKNFDSSMFGVVKKIITLVQDNYAERLHMAFILYPNFLVKTGMAIMRPFLSDKTKQKLVMLDKETGLIPYMGEQFKVPKDGKPIEAVVEEEEEEKIKQMLKDCS